MEKHSLLGKSARQRIRAELEAQRREMDTWEEAAIGADYPENKPDGRVEHVRAERNVPSA
jgi:hypothetical protein